MLESRGRINIPLLSYKGKDMGERIILLKKPDIVHGLVLVLLVVVFVLFMAGCSSAEIADMDLPENGSQEELISQIEGWDANTTVLGTITHGVRRDEIDGNSLTYTGGELQVPYEVMATGSVVDVGFLVFLDGEPQKYHCDEEGDESYCHVLKLENGVKKEFALSFTPACGEAGEKLQMTVLSVYNPDFKPDMQQTSGYGMYHNTLMATFEVEMKSASPFGGRKGISAAMVMDITQGKEEMTREFLEGPISNFYGMQKMTQENLDTKIFDGVCYDGEYLMNYISLTEEPLQITYRIFGKDGSRYKVTPFIDHMPVGDAQDILVSKGEVSTITLSVDPKKLGDFSTFYFIAIPENMENGMPQRKTDSILLYKAEALSDSEQDKPSETGVENQEDALNRRETESDGEWFRGWEFDGGIRNICYAGEGRILIQANALWLYDMEDQRMVGQYTVEEGTVRGLEVFPVPGGYLLTGEMINSTEGMESKKTGLSQGMGSGRRVRCWCFDQNFLWQKTLALDELFTDIMDRVSLTASVSPDGNQIILKGNDALYIYHMDTEKLDKLVIEDTWDLKSDGEGLLIFEARFGHEGKDLIFSGLKAGDGGSASAYGKIGLEGEGVLWNTIPDYEMSGDIMLCQEEVCFPAVYGKAEGKLFLVEETNFSGRILALDTDDRASGVFSSDHGRYIATVSSLKNKKGWRIRIYERTSGEKICDRNVEADDEKYFYRTPKICVFEEQNQCIVLNGADGDSLIYSFTFP